LPLTVASFDTSIDTIALLLLQRAIINVCFLSCLLQIHTLSYEELQQRIAGLDPEMEREIEELRKRYQAKRQPIIDAIDAKKRRLQKY